MYIRPLVQVYQEYERLSGTAQGAILNPCIIGPCYHIIDGESALTSDVELSAFGTIDNTGKPATVVPNMAAGAVLKEDSVKLFFRDVYVELAAAPKTVTTLSENELTFLEANYPTGIAVGDYVTVTNSEDDSVIADKLAVISVTPATFKVKLAKAINTAVATLEATPLRKVADFTKEYDASEITVDTTLDKVTIAPISIDTKLVHYALVRCGYKALRQDVTEFQSAGTTTEILSKIGKIDRENPLAYGAMLCLANTNTSVYFIGVPSDDAAGYTAAKDIIENLDNVYSIVPLTQDSGILTIFGTHAAAMSVPNVGRWRICFGNTPLPTTVTLASGDAYVEDTVGGDPRVIHCEDADFITNGVASGHTLVLTIGSTPTTFTVASIIAENKLTVTEDITGVTLDTVLYAFEVTTVADKVLQAIDIKKTSQSFNSGRFYHVWPDIAVIDGVNEPGYYLCCAIAGMVAGLPSHQGFTRISIAGITAVRHSGDYFNSEQLDIIADGGTFILTQLSPSAPPFVRHQLSTDTSSYEMRELSFVKNFDYVSYICKDTLDAFIGQYNVTQSTLGVLDTSIRAVLESLKLYSVAKIGSPVIDYDIVSIAQSEDDRSRVDMYVDVEFPYALNTVGLHIVSTDI